MCFLSTKFGKIQDLSKGKQRVKLVLSFPNSSRGNMSTLNCNPNLKMQEYTASYAVMFSLELHLCVRDGFC